MIPAAIPFKFAGVGAAILSLLLLLALWRIDSLSGKLDAERVRHKATQEALVREVEKGLGWKNAYEGAIKAAEAHRLAAQTCYELAAEAETAREKRAEILQAAPTRARTETEKTQVVDDETRVRVADRLNRPW